MKPTLRQITRQITCAAALATLTACTYSLPVTGEFDGTPAQGKATASLKGGTFEASQANGLKCTGTYDATSSEITLTGPVTCNDGRTGTALITRKTNLVSGTVLVKLSDGKEGRFVFGNLSFAEEFRRAP